MDVFQVRSVWPYFTRLDFKWVEYEKILEVHKILSTIYRNQN